MNTAIPQAQSGKGSVAKTRTWIICGAAIMALALIIRASTAVPLWAKVPSDVTLNVTLESAKTLPLLTASNFIVTDNGQLQNVQVVAGPQLPSPLHVALVLEEGMAPSLNNQLANLRHFVEQLPNGTNVMVATIDRNHANIVMPFTTDLSHAAGSISANWDTPSQVPLNAFVSLSEVIDRFRGLEGRKEIVMIGPGYDILQDEITPSFNIDLIQAETKARKENVVVHTIWVPSAAGPSGHMDLSGASNMFDLADATGGLSFWNVDRSIVQNLMGRLNTIREAINHQYILHFSPDLLPNQSHHIKVKLKDVQEAREIKINFPNR